ncbi:MAG: AAA family ATPase [Propionibacteriaceae bacterium]|jgi:pilus assembly protein CpaE|nr:AAA family ATPase [Propionibacteriaceae bacterium]
MSVNIALVSSDSALRDAFLTVAAESAEIEIADTLANGEELLRLLGERGDIDVVAVAAEYDALAAIDLVREIGRAYPLVAVLLVAEPDFPLARAIEAGARGIINMPISLQDAQDKVTSAAAWRAGLLAVLRRTGDPLTDRGKVVALAGAKGGVGVSTLAVVMAMEATRLGQRVCLVDLDLLSGDLGYLCSVNPRRSVADLAGLVGDVGPRGIREVLVDVPVGFALLGAPERVEQAEGISEAAIRTILNELRLHFSLVIVDCGCYLDDARAGAIDSADKVCLVLSGDLISLRSARRGLDSWERLDIRSAGDVQLVLNLDHRKREVRPELVGRVLKHEVSAVVPNAPDELVGEVNTGTLTTKRPPAVGDAVGRLLVALGIVAKRARSDSGQSAVELPFAVLGTLVAFLVCVQAVLLGFGHIMAANAVNEVSRVASVNYQSLSDGRTGAVEELEETARQAMWGFNLDTALEYDHEGRQVAVTVKVPALISVLPEEITSARAQAGFVPREG